LEKELTGNFRQVRPQGPGDLLAERYDSIFRRNLLEPLAPIGENKKRANKS